LGEEVVPIVMNKDKGGNGFYFDFTDRCHAEFGEADKILAFEVPLGEP
jgi:hypothetical protein